jgi:SAM-dependent methyltransferase
MGSESKTYKAFANFWNNPFECFVCTREQFEDWFAPLTKYDIEGERVLELGCGNGLLKVHWVTWKLVYLEGIDLDDPVITAEIYLDKRENVQVTKNNVRSFEK